MRYLRLILLILACMASMSVSTAALAQRGNSGDLQQAIRSVEQQTGGRVLSAEKRIVNGQVKYRLKVLTPSGHVRVITIDAN